MEDYNITTVYLLGPLAEVDTRAAVTLHPTTFTWNTTKKGNTSAEIVEITVK